MVPKGEGLHVKMEVTELRVQKTVNITELEHTRYDLQHGSIELGNMCEAVKSNGLSCATDPIGIAVSWGGL